MRGESERGGMVRRVRVHGWNMSGERGMLVNKDHLKIMGKEQVVY